jgi:hypothetical protein
VGAELAEFQWDQPTKHSQPQESTMTDGRFFSWKTTCLLVAGFDQLEKYESPLG